jgi:hypothetical protein
VYPKAKECHGDRSAERLWPEQRGYVPGTVFNQQRAFRAEWSHPLFSVAETKGGSTSLAMTV